MPRRLDLEIRDGLDRLYDDILTPRALDVLQALAPLNARRLELMALRQERRATRFREKQPVGFLDPSQSIGHTGLTVGDARAGRFTGQPIPDDLQRQWIQGTGPAARPRATVEQCLRNVAYALLSGADGWMFDGEDALGQVDSMSLDNQRSLRLALAGDERFLDVAERVSGEMNAWSREMLGRPLHDDYRDQLEFTTRIYRARGLHLDDRHIRERDGTGFSASIVDAVLYVVGNHRALQDRGNSIVLYLPKIQTAEEAALWAEILDGIENALGLQRGTIRCYVLVEQLEASFQLMEIRAALGSHFVGYNTGRWDYINSVADAMAFDPEFVNPNIDAITMTYGYMRHYEDRVRRAVNTPDSDGNFTLWQGGMEPNIPVGTPTGVEEGMARALAGGERERTEGASGKWVAHWKMVPIVRPVWEVAGDDNQMGREFGPLEYGPEDAAGLTLLEDAPRTIRGARDLLSVAMQYGNAFGRGFSAAALKPADFFGNADVLYLMEDMATCEIRVSILWEWLHKGAAFTEDDPETGVSAGDVFDRELFERLVEEEYAKLRGATDRDVHDDSKNTTLPIAREIARAVVSHPTKAPWAIDLLNLNLNNHDRDEAVRRIDLYYEALDGRGERLTSNSDFLATDEEFTT
jgi:malate synthase